jgi:hypothetical protein
VGHRKACGVKLYAKVSAVVAELIANSYDADTTGAEVEFPLGTDLATKFDSRLRQGQSREKSEVEGGSDETKHRT